MLILKHGKYVMESLFVRPISCMGENRLVFSDIINCHQHWHPLSSAACQLTVERLSELKVSNVGLSGGRIENFTRAFDWHNGP